MRHYATLFDSRYLPQGLVLYESLKKHSSEPFTLHVLALDEGKEEVVFDSLWRLNLPSMVITSLDALEIRSHLYTIPSRTWQEYCWTLASQFTEDVLTRYGVDITYLDADMMFFSDPKVIHDEIGDRSIAVIPHRLIPSKKHLETNGKFNVSWVTFKNNPIGRECLSTWAAQCREKCSATDGCGDQLYLNSWPDKYGPELCVIHNIGAGLAPWNLANYKVLAESLWRPRPFIEDLATFVVRIGRQQNMVPVVFYHYHEYIHGERLTNYELRPEDIKLIYEPYIAAVSAAKAKIESLHIPAG